MADTGFSHPSTAGASAFQRGEQFWRFCCQTIDDINARQTNCKTPPKPVVPKEDPCTKTRNDIAAKSKAGRDAALAYVSRTRPGKNGYYVRYNHPPIYCGGTWTAAARPYYMKTFETVREITRLSNNGNQITAIGTW